jgi:hypothetical protein
VKDKIKTPTIVLKKIEKRHQRVHTAYKKIPKIYSNKFIIQITNNYQVRGKTPQLI